MPMMEGFKAAGSTMALGISAPCSGSEASSHHCFGGVMAIPCFPSTNGNYPDHRYYGYDPGSSYYGNYPDYGYGSQPNARQTWYYSPTRLAIIHMWHTATPCGSTAPPLQ